jgi:Zn-dependent protease with chaperone function
MATGPGIFFDGITSARHEVAVAADTDALRVRAASGKLLAEWPYADVQPLSAPKEVLRLGRSGSAVLARLEVRDAALAAAIDSHAISVDRTGARERRNRHKVIAWTFAATMSLLLVAFFGVPLLVERLTPLIPFSVEHKFGIAIDKQVRAMLDPGTAGKAFECGEGPGERAGRAALDLLMGKLEAAAELPIPLKVAVVRRTEANAVALPGGHIYVFQGLIRTANTPDELAGVIGHEIGHVAHRDGTRAVLQAAGLSFLFGMLLGDFTGGGVVVIAAKTIVQSAHSREGESAADLYGVRLMNKIGGDGRALGTILTRISGSGDSGIKILLDHPDGKARAAAINAVASDRRGPPLLTASQWADLKRVCG